MTAKLSIGVDTITGEIKVGRSKEVRPGMYMFTGDTEIVTDRAFQCVVESCHITKTTEFTGNIYGKKFKLTYKEEDSEKGSPDAYDGPVRATVPEFEIKCNECGRLAHVRMDTPEEAEEWFAR